ncbi:MAG: DnaJ domain-containing protein [Clostridiales bacterium]|nr:DnaJ domain-containing protein [Clostridiales bacterium]
MNNPFEVLGLRGWADQEEIRNAYRTLVKQCHPDMIRDPVLKQEAQARMVALNLAYEEALRLAAPRQQASPAGEIPPAAAILMAERMLAKGNPEGALRQLLKCEKRDGDWYYMQGKVLMAMDQYETAHQSFREAVRLCPDNNVYRSGALAAAVAHRESLTLHGKVRKTFKRLIPKK